MRSRLGFALALFCIAPSLRMAAEALPPLPKDAFTYVVIPDTQLYHGEGSKVRKGETPQTGPTANPAFKSRIDWIVQNRERENIVFVSHVGDITDIHSEPQWAFASNLMARLDGIVPYGISPGNHDLEVCTSDGFNRYFPRSRYAGREWYAGAFDGYVRADGQKVSGGNANSCQTFEAGGMKFVVLHLECNAPAPVLEWAGAMMDKYADRLAIICTHMYLGYRTRELYKGRKGKKKIPDEWFGLMNWSKCHKKDGVAPVKAWETCFSKHKNLILVVSGDQGPAICWRETQKGVHGNVVHAVMQDYPRTADDQDWLRLYRFRPELHQIEVWTWSPQQNAVCETAGFRKGRDWHVFTLPLAPQFFKVAERRTVSARPVGRTAFERGEEGAELKLNVVGTDDVFAVPVETRLKPGEYEMPVPIVGRLLSGEEVVATNSVKIRIGPTFADRMPAVMWVGGRVEDAPVRDFGFTHVLCGGAVTNTNDVAGQARNLIEIYDNSLAAGMRRMHSLQVQYPVGGKGRKRYYRCQRDGTQPPRPRDVNQPEVSNPELLAYARRLVAAENEAVGYHPGFAGVLPCSEKRDHSYPSFNTEHLRYKVATGREVPPEAKKKVLEYPIAKQRFPDGVVPVDDSLYAYYSWFWGRGDGWLDYLGGIADEYRKFAGRYGDGSAIQRKRPFFSFWDPAVRCPPKWGSGGDVDVISQWVYAQPEPMNVAGPAEEVIAMAAGRTGQLPMIMTQLICYRAQLAPTNITVSPLPEWVKRRPRASFPTIPADSLQEAVWSMLAKPVKGIMFHGWRTIFETGAETGYTYTSPETAVRMKELLRGLVAPLGPTLKDLGRDEPEVVVLESFTTTAFGGPGSWGWFSSPIMFLQRARLDPRVIYEETIMRDGFGKAKILYAPQCEFLSAPVVEKVKAFQGAGGILLADEKLLPALKADIVVPVFAYRKPPKSDHTADMDAIMQTRVCEEARRHTEKSKADMLSAADALRRTLKEKHAYEPRVDSSSPEIVTFSRAWLGTQYVFALNDRRTFGDYVGQWGLTMEKGLPLSGNVTLNDQDGKIGAVYELSRGGEVPFRRLADGRVEVPLSYETNDGRLLMCLKHKIANVEVACCRQGGDICVTMTVRDDTRMPVPARLPVEIRVFDAAGQELDGAGYACAENGICKLTVCTNLNDPPGGYRVVCRDRASGIAARYRVK